MRQTLPTGASSPPPVRATPTCSWPSSTPTATAPWARSRACSRPDARAIRVVTGLRDDRRARPAAEHADLDARAHLDLPRQVGVGDALADAVAVAARRDPPARHPADPH